MRKDHTALELDDIVEASTGNQIGVPSRYRVIALSRGPRFAEQECEYIAEHVSGQNSHLHRKSMDDAPYLVIDNRTWNVKYRLVEMR